MNATNSLPPHASTLADPNAPLGLHALFLGRECCPVQVITDDESIETIVVICARTPVAHHVVKDRYGSRPLNPDANIRLVAWVDEGPETLHLESEAS